MNLVEIHNENENVDNFVKGLKCLSFIPYGEVKTTYYWLKNHTLFPQELSALYDYFDKTYIGSDIKRAIHPIKIWINLEKALMGLPKTNNAIQGWHNIFRASFGPLNKFENLLKKFKKKI